jgi:hypothetical protein
MLSRTPQELCDYRSNPIGLTLREQVRAINQRYGGGRPNLSQAAPVQLPDLRRRRHPANKSPARAKRVENGTKCYS